jgi:hypothetical protein
MKTIRAEWLRFAILLSVPFGLLWFSEEFSPVRVFEPESTGWKLWFSYAKDLLQPFALYLFLCLGEKWLQTWQTRACVAFGVPLLLELFQFFYYRVAPTHYVGSFDPLDIVMYATGVGLAVIVEQLLVVKILPSKFI